MIFFFEQAAVSPTELLGYPPMRLFVQNNSSQLVSFADIVYLEAEGNQCWVGLQNGQRLLTTKTLKHQQEQLPADWFVRLHRNSIVNRLFMEKIEQVDGSYQVSTTIDKSFMISRRRWSEIRQQLLGKQATRSRSIKVSFRK